ncbi:unnamed protein product [Didymodactylos carnosus]|uniref:Protein fem-1 homolog B n=1 Tax=Didymodactylos carnosus TaxID=1234261 RepID=A0A815IKJ2_9BILA|nr:unnamed protein product [Didymodactylos carnosus]CAF1366715.1 unnamed protein product [Didymodactylos carnosus]CAF4171767.1 unnamed protein product [Didymodactylos carnosus]CAF4249429.1 unnamed protein product [Didymodactylos carnosus]
MDFEELFEDDDYNIISNPIGQTFYEDSRDGHTINVQSYLEILPSCDTDRYINTLYDDDDGMKCTPLMIACKLGYYEIVQLFLVLCEPKLEIEGTIILNNYRTEGVTALWIASGAGHFLIVQLLVEYGANVNHLTSSTHSTPLRAACYIGHMEIIRYLIERGGADQHMLNISNNSNLSLAVSRGHTELVEYLLKLQCNPNIQTEPDQKTALHEACEDGHLNYVQLLLEYNAQSLKDVDGQTPLMIASLNQHPDIVHYFIEHNYCTDQESIDALELLGSSYYCQQSANAQEGFQYLLKAVKLREEYQLTRVPCDHFSIDNYNKCQTEDELHHIRHTMELMQLESLTIYRKQLGEKSKTFLYALRYCGGICADEENYKSCLKLWFYGLQLNKLTNFVVSRDTDLLRLFATVLVELDRNQLNEILYQNDMLKDVLLLAIAELQYNRKLIATSNGDQRVVEQEKFDYNLYTMLCLITILSKFEDDLDRKQFYPLIYKLNYLNFKMKDNTTLLHLAVNRQSAINGYSLGQSYK